MPLLLIATLDTKGEELGFVRDLLRAAGQATVVVDVGTAGPPRIEPDIPRDEVLRLAGTTMAALREQGDRGEAVAAMARGIVALVHSFDQDDLIGVFALGGSAGTVIGSAALRALPFGLPKVLVSTLASGQTRPFLGGSDIVLIPSVADLAGLNRITRVALRHAARALLGMVMDWPQPPGQAVVRSSQRLTVAATMFGVTTRCIEQFRDHLATLSPDRAVELIVFHATGTGGEAMEALIREGQVQLLFDLTTTELADEIVGGILSAGPNRLWAAIEQNVPQVVSVGALDMVNFGPRATVPERFAGRRFHQHNPAVTLMRTTPEECRQIGQQIARVLRQAAMPTVVLLPQGGISALDVPGTPWHDPLANAALFDAIRQGLAGSPQVTIVERAEHINDPTFAHEAARLLLQTIPTFPPARPLLAPPRLPKVEP